MQAFTNERHGKVVQKLNAVHQEACPQSLGNGEVDKPNAGIVGATPTLLLQQILNRSGRGYDVW
jgi:hypothetical protein